MSKECIPNCPRIQAALEQMESDNTWAGPMYWHPDMSAPERLAQLCLETYDCQGVEEGITEISVQGLIFSKRKQFKGTCPLDQR